MANSVVGLELVCLGSPTVRVGGAEAAADVLWRRNLALLVYLALSPEQTRTREQLMGMLWPEKPQANAAHSLNEAVRRCRAALGRDRVITETGKIRLNPLNLTVDIWSLEKAEAPETVNVLDLVRGDFLEGFHIDDAEPFETWVATERSRIRDLSLELVIDAGVSALASGKHGEAIKYARRGLALQPHSEPAAALAMRAAALAGDSGTALSLYHEFASDLAAQLGEKPGRHLQELAERVRTGEWRKHSGKYVDLEPPLVGRGALHRSLFSTFGQGGAPQALLIAISGEAGTGRSRLLRECTDRLMLDNTFVVVVRLLETDYDAPWSTLRAIMRAGLAKAPGMAAAAPPAMALLAGVVPELADRVDAVKSDDRLEIADALTEFVVAAAEERPLAIAIDDAHWSDRATLDALQHVMQQTSRLPITLLLTVATEVQPPGQLTSLLERAGRDFAGKHIRIGAFSTEEMKELVGRLAPWCDSDADGDRLTRRVALESGGNPFLAVTLLRDLDKVTRLREDLLTWPPPGSTYDAPLPFSIPSMVKVAVAARLARLSSAAMAVVRASSVCGMSVDPELVGGLTDLKSKQLEAALDELERERFLAYTEGRYVFNGRLIPEVIRSECVSRGEQQRLRRQAAELLGSRDDFESRSLRAELLMAEAQHEEALNSALGIVEAAIRFGAFRTAERALAMAESAAPHAASEQRFRIDHYRQELTG